MVSSKPKEGESLADLFPDVASQWHPTLNDNLVPSDFKKGSDKRVWWKCDVADDHEWEGKISARVRAKDCPFCVGRRVSITNSLASLAPEIASQWHPTKNGNLTPDDVVAGATKKVWWKCDVADDHEWETKLVNRTQRNRGCPFCAGREVSSTNSLATMYPNVAKYWHPSKNGDLTPNDVTGGSEKKVWWKCPVGADHEWKTGIYNKVKHDCPFCSGYQVSVTNSLSSLFPEIASQWHPTKNGSLTPDDVVAGTHDKAWWKCDVADDHVWRINISNRTAQSSGCPACAGQQVSTTNTLAHLFPEVASQWHPTKNGNLTPHDVTGGANKRVWWKCDKGPDHEWQAPIPGRTSHGKQCPACMGQQVSVTNSLAALFPHIAKQWHPTKNGDLTPDDVTAGTPKKYWWKCEADDSHDFDSSVGSRTGRGRGCPSCTLTPRSAQEIRLSHELSALIDFDLEEHKVRIRGRVRDVDIVLEGLGVVVEFDGAYWHRNKADKDLEKAQKLEAEGWNVIRVREIPLDSIHKNDVMVKTLAPAKEVADLVLQKITEVTGVKIPKLKEYLASDEPWREKEALVAIREYQAENARKKAERDAKRKAKKKS